MTNVNKTVAAAVLSGALFSLATPTPATAQDNKSGTNQPDPIATQLADIKKDLKTLNEVLLGRKDKEGYPIESSPGLVAELNKLSDRLAAVETELKKMKAQQQSSSLRPNTLTPGTTSPAPAVIAAKGIVRVVNEYPVQISIVVNGTSYRVAPTRTLDVEVPAGEFSYQLLESGGATTKSTIKDKETVTLRIK